VIGDNKNDVSGSYSESYVTVMTICISLCEGCFFCDDATWCAEGDHDVDLGLEKRESNPKFN
jgi:hypothetical protein